MSGQFDVHRNPERNRRIPDVVVVQSNRFRDANTRIIIPLIAVDIADNQKSDVSPVFEIEGDLVILAPLQIPTCGATSWARLLPHLPTKTAA